MGLILVSVLVPAEWVSVLRHRWWWFTYPLDRIESMRSAVNLVHAILFMSLGMSMRLALPSWSVVRMASVVISLGAGTELLQLFVPGRHFRLSDIVVDVLAGVLGWTVMRVLLR